MRRALTKHPVKQPMKRYQTCSMYTRSFNLLNVYLLLWDRICVTMSHHLFFPKMQNIDEESGTKIEVQGGEETLLPAVVEDSEAAGSCNSKETTNSCIQLIYTFFFFCPESYCREAWNIK